MSRRETGLCVERSGPVAYLTIDRPDRANALDTELVVDLTDRYEELDADPEVRLAVLRGAGRGFSSGHAMGEPDPGGDGAALRDWDRLSLINRSVRRLWEGGTPILAAVHGYCLGAAVELVLCADFALAAESARFAHPALRSGGGTPTECVYPFLMGLRRAKEYLWLSRELTGAEAQEWGLVNRCVPDDALAAEVEIWAARLVAMPADNIRISRRLLHRICDAQGFRAGLEMGVEYGPIAHLSADAAAWRATVRDKGLREAVRARDAPFQVSADE